MSSEVQCWRIHIKNLEAKIRIGLYAHEREPQRIIVNATIEAMYSPTPKTIEECFDYDHVHRLVTVEWPKRPHAWLLETCVVELMTDIFKSDARVSRVKVCIVKPDIFPEAESVGVETEWTREDFIRLSPRVCE